MRYETRIEHGAIMVTQNQTVPSKNQLTCSYSGKYRCRPLWYSVVVGYVCFNFDCEGTMNIDVNCERVGTEGWEIGVVLKSGTPSLG